MYLKNIEDTSILSNIHCRFHSLRKNKQVHSYYFILFALILINDKLNICKRTVLK